MRVTITGAAGMLGHALLAKAPQEAEVSGVDLTDGDLSTPEGAQQALATHEPEMVIHCAAWTDVDGCTADPGRAVLQNAAATGNVARVCAELGARMLAMSTDYVFDGTKGTPYTEEDEPNPLNPYGASKLAAERALQHTLENHLIIRSQWLFGPHGKNFVATILQKGGELRRLRVVADEYGCPTYTYDLAEAIWRVALSDVRGLLHLTNNGVCSWVDLARDVLSAAGLKGATIEPIPAGDWPSPTMRPRYSALANERWAKLGYAPLRPWREALREYVRKHLTAPR